METHLKLAKGLFMEVQFGQEATQVSSKLAKRLWKYVQNWQRRYKSTLKTNQEAVKARSKLTKTL